MKEANVIRDEIFSSLAAFAREASSAIASAVELGGSASLYLLPGNTVRTELVFYLARAGENTHESIETECPRPDGTTTRETIKPFLITTVPLSPLRIARMTMKEALRLEGLRIADETFLKSLDTLSPEAIMDSYQIMMEKRKQAEREEDQSTSAPRPLPESVKGGYSHGSPAAAIDPGARERESGASYDEPGSRMGGAARLSEYGKWNIEQWGRAAVALVNYPQKLSRLLEDYRWHCSSSEASYDNLRDEVDSQVRIALARSWATCKNEYRRESCSASPDIKVKGLEY